MEKSKEIEVSYFRQKDILSIHILPKRPAKTGGSEEDFLIRYDWDDPKTIAGFEILDFSLIIPKIYNHAIVPDLPMKFSIKGTDETDLTLQEVLEWAYLAFVLRKEEVPTFV
ncbi:MAG: DUF2283 domain-containing protein [candidate division KSB1 bacterium]|nr:DUF2283 domain-containing protein [candidate division KSB1 bacterium]MDZ7366307.1 DUF2283 domain-containing protein [candidate division KSB1 bacterium]MDZ7403963.1 DUF2283 domain-containing protein [candidate division KSB1 bacterium]